MRSIISKHLLQALVVLQFFTFLGLPWRAFAQEAINPGFDPGLLISDIAFSDTATFGSAAGVQQFLETRGSILAKTDADFLTKLREPTDQDWKSRLDDPRASLGRLRTAAELIYDASISAGLNPQVIIVTLQKEQSLITKNFSSDSDLRRALDRSLGYGCPDNQPCQASFLGFYTQLFGTFDAEGNRWIGAAKSLYRSFTYESGGSRTGRGPLIDSQNQAFGSGPFVRPSRQGDLITFENTLNGFSGVTNIQTVQIKNFATAALYRYTPHVFNGNYNFWKFYQEWFRYPNGTVIKLGSDSSLWVIDNGQRRTFSNFVGSQRGINSSNPITVSPTEFSSYVAGTPLVPKDGTLVTTQEEGITYLIETGRRHKITAFTASQRKLNLTNTVTLSKAEVDSYALGSILLPLEGTLFNAIGDGTVYVMVGQEARPLTFAVFQQRKYSFANVVALPLAEVAEIPKGKLMPPVDGTLVKGPSLPAVYLVESGTKRVLSGTVFQQRKYSFRNVVALGQEEIDALTIGLPVPPANNTLIKSETNPTVYLMWQGNKVPITGMVFRLRSLQTKLIVVLSKDEIDALPEDPNPLPPKDGSVVKAVGEPTIYLVQQEQLRPLTLAAFNNRRFRFSQVVEFDAAELNLYEKGEIIVK